MLIFVFLILAIISGIVINNINENIKYAIVILSTSLIILILSSVCLTFFGTYYLVSHASYKADRENINKEYQLLLYKLKDFETLDNNEKVQFLIHNTFITDINEFNKTRENYQNKMDNIWISPLFPDIYIDTDYITIDEGE